MSSRHFIHTLLIIRSIMSNISKDNGLFGWLLDCCGGEATKPTGQELIDARHMFLDKLAIPRRLQFTLQHGGVIIFEARESIKGKQSDMKELFDLYDTNSDEVLKQRELHLLASDLFTITITATKCAINLARQLGLIDINGINLQKTQMRGDNNQLDDILDTVDTMAKSNNGADVLMEILDEDSNGSISFNEFLSRVDVFVKLLLDRLFDSIYCHQDFLAGNRLSVSNTKN